MCILRYYCRRHRHLNVEATLGEADDDAAFSTTCGAAAMPHSAQRVVLPPRVGAAHAASHGMPASQAKQKMLLREVMKTPYV